MIRQGPASNAVSSCAFLRKKWEISAPLNSIKIAVTDKFHAKRER